jgi:hypothetical protein
MINRDFFRFLTLRFVTLLGLGCTVISALQGCGSAQPNTTSPQPVFAAGPPAGFFLPADAFGKSGNEAKPASVTPTVVAAAPNSRPATVTPVIVPAPAPLVVTPIPPPPVPVPVLIPVPQSVAVVIAPLAAQRVSDQLAGTTASPSRQIFRDGKAAESSSYLCLIFSQLDGCESAKPSSGITLGASAANPPPGFFLPLGTFGNPVMGTKESAGASYPSCSACGYQVACSVRSSCGSGCQAGFATAPHSCVCAHDSHQSD